MIPPPNPLQHTTPQTTASKYAAPGSNDAGRALERLHKIAKNDKKIAQRLRNRRNLAVVKEHDDDTEMKETDAGQPVVDERVVNNAKKEFRTTKQIHKDKVEG